MPDHLPLREAASDIAVAIKELRELDELSGFFPRLAKAKLGATIAILDKAHERAQDALGAPE